MVGAATDGGSACRDCGCGRVDPSCRDRRHRFRGRRAGDGIRRRPLCRVAASGLRVAGGARHEDVHHPDPAPPAARSCRCRRWRVRHRAGCDPVDATRSLAAHHSLSNEHVARPVTGIGPRIPRLGLADHQKQRVHPSEPHWYLQAIGTSPGARGLGYGRELLQSRLGPCDHENASAYLETSNPGNLAYYERFGFTVRDQMTMYFGGPRVWLMWRPPQQDGR
ncbi:GNAT family N-acetyltransferase [Nocardia sp. NPDC046763]|uniref:GNAT family N-acetyltransferase n=1 Tax=Nocardia sp. NPDC046763 TaxID=3155256 RepID=UPI0033E40E70